MGELWKLVEQGVLPFYSKSAPGTARLDNIQKCSLCKALLSRDDVLLVGVEKKGRKEFVQLLEDARENAEVRNSIQARIDKIRVRCTQSARDNMLVEGQISLLQQMSQSERKCLEVIAKKRYKGFLQKDLGTTIGVTQCVAYNCLKSLVDYQLVVKQRIIVKTSEKSKQKAIVQLVFLKSFLPRDIYEQQKADFAFLPVLDKTASPSVSLSDSTSATEYVKSVLELLKNAPGEVLRARQMQGQLGLDFKKWSYLERHLLSSELVEECVYNEGNKQIRCLKLKRGDDPSSSGRKEEGEDKTSIRGLAGSHVYAESFPTQDIIRMILSKPSRSARLNDINVSCCLEPKRVANIMKELEDENVLKKTKYNVGREIGWEFSWVSPASPTDVPPGAASGKKAPSSNPTYTLNNKLRQEFILNVLKKRKFVLVSHLRKIFKEIEERPGFDEPIFNDSKTTERSFEALAEEGKCQVQNVRLNRKTSLQSYICKVLLRKGVKIDKDLLQEIQQASTVKTVGKKKYEHRKQVDEVAILSSVGVAKAVKSEFKDNHVKSESPLGNDSANLAIKNNSWLDSCFRLNGFMVGIARRARALHEYLWKCSFREQQKHSVDLRPLNIRRCVSNMAIEDFVRIVGVLKFPEEIVEHGYSYVHELPQAIQDDFLSVRAQERIMKVVNLLKDLGLVEEYINLEIEERSHSEIVLKETACITANEENSIRDEFEGAIQSREQTEDGEQFLFDLDTQFKCSAYWECLQKVFDESDSAWCAEQGLYPASVLGLIGQSPQVQMKWEEGPSSCRTLTYKVRHELIREFGSKSKVFVKCRNKVETNINCKSLSAKYHVEESVIRDVAKWWAKATHLEPMAKSIASELLQERSKIGHVTYSLLGGENHATYSPSTSRNELKGIRQAIRKRLRKEFEDEAKAEENDKKKMVKKTEPTKTPEKAPSAPTVTKVTKVTKVTTTAKKKPPPKTLKTMEQIKTELNRMKKLKKMKKINSKKKISKTSSIPKISKATPEKSKATPKISKATPKSKKSFTARDDEILVRAFAISKFTEPEVPFIRWQQIPGIPSYLPGPTLSRRLTKLKQVPLVKSALDSISKICLPPQPVNLGLDPKQDRSESSRPGKEGGDGHQSNDVARESVTASQDVGPASETVPWTYPDSLRRMCSKNRKLTWMLADRGNAFAKKWHTKIDEAIAVVKECNTTTSVIQKAVPRKVPKKPIQRGIRMQEPVFHSEIPLYRPLAQIRKVTKRPKITNDQDNNKEVMEQIYDGPPETIEKSIISDSIVSYCIGGPPPIGTPSLSNELDSLTDFMRGCPDQSLKEVLTFLKNSNILQNSKVHGVQLTTRMRNMLKSGPISEPMLKKLLALHNKEMANLKSSAARGRKISHSSLSYPSLVHYLALLSSGAISADTDVRKYLSQTSPGPSSSVGDAAIDEVIKACLQIGCDAAKIEEEKKLLACHEKLVRNLTKLPQMQGTAEMEKEEEEESSVEKGLLEIVGAAETKGIKASQLSIHVGEKYTGEEVDSALSGLIDSGKVVVMSIGDCQYYIHDKFSKTFRCKTSKGLGSGLPYRPWLNPLSGKLNKKVLNFIKTKVLSIVFRNPGIKEENIFAQFDLFFTEHHIQEVLSFMTSSGMLSVKEVSRPSLSFSEEWDSNTNKKESEEQESTRHYFTTLSPHQFQQSLDFE